MAVRYVKCQLELALINDVRLDDEGVFGSELFGDIELWLAEFCWSKLWRNDFVRLS